MKASILEKLDILVDRQEEVGMLLSEASVISDQKRFLELSKEYAQNTEVVDTYQQLRQANADLESANEMLSESDPEIKQMAQDEIKDCKVNISDLEVKLQTFLLPKDPRDSHNVYLEIRAGTGGDEAAIFAGDLFRMYSRYAENNKWTVDILSVSEGEHGGYREIISRISGHGVFSRLKFESGAHRVQRVPETESQGRVHTSAATVAILAEAPETEAIEINNSDLRIDTFRASGAGGQHVNKTDSAIRLTHVPTGLVVECQDQRSQHKNKARAMALLQAKLNDIESTKAAEEQSETRKLQVGTGDRSERIRTYNFPQGRVTDHRINLTLYKLDEFINGNADVVIKPLLHEYQANLMTELDSN